MQVQIQALAKGLASFYSPLVSVLARCQFLHNDPIRVNLTRDLTGLPGVPAYDSGTGSGAGAGSGSGVGVGAGVGCEEVVSNDL